MSRRWPLVIVIFVMNASLVFVLFCFSFCFRTRGGYRFFFSLFVFCFLRSFSTLFGWGILCSEVWLSLFATGFSVINIIPCLDFDLRFNNKQTSLHVTQHYVAERHTCIILSYKHFRFLFLTSPRNILLVKIMEFACISGEQERTTIFCDQRRQGTLT